MFSARILQAIEHAATALRERMEVGIPRVFVRNFVIDLTMTNNFI